MAGKSRAMLLFFLMLTLPLAGCITTESSAPEILDEGNDMMSNSCSLPSQSLRKVQCQSW